MAAERAAVVDIRRVDPENVTIAVRHGDDEVTYAFRYVAGPPLAAVDYEWRFQRDFSDDQAAFRMILDVARRAFHGEEPSLPLAVPDGRSAPADGSTVDRP